MLSEKLFIILAVCALAISSPLHGQALANAQNHNQRGLEYSKDGKHELAEEEFTQVIAIEPGLDSAYSNRGRVLLKQGKLAAAIQDFDKAIQLRTDSFSTYR